MNRISRRRRGEESVQFGGFRIAYLLFADDVVLLASTHQDLQQALGWFAAECEAVGMRVVTERIRSWIQAAEMSFLRRVTGLSFRDTVKSSDIPGRQGVEPLLLRIERSQLRWFGHLVRMPPGCLPLEVFQARQTWRRPQGRPRIRWRDYISLLTWERLGIPQEELMNVATEKMSGSHCLA